MSAIALKSRRILTLMHGHWYRVKTTEGKVFEWVSWDKERMVFRMRGPIEQTNGRVRALTLDVVTHVAPRDDGTEGAPFFYIEDCYLEPVRAQVLS